MKKLLAAALLGLFVVGCSSQSSVGPYYGSETTANRTGTNLWVHKLAEAVAGKADAMDVPRSDRQRHQRCVFFALETLNLGERCRWEGDTSGAWGEVQVTAVYPSGARMCHVFFTHLELGNGSKKNWDDTACYHQHEEKWQFISDY